MFKKIKLSLVFLLLVNFLSAQDSTLPFWEDIQAFKKHDSTSFPPSHAILFIGSSSFTRWTDMQNYFPGHMVVNRGFGGSTIPDLIRYLDDIVFPYQPKQIVIYCGENDFASADTISATIVFNRFKQLFQAIRNHLPGIPIAFVSIKPSPSREKLWPKMADANLLVKEYLQHNQAATFVDVYHAMFNKDGKVMKDIFTEDDLHMNAKGYAIWQKVMESYLLPANTNKK